MKRAISVLLLAMSLGLPAYAAELGRPLQIFKDQQGVLRFGLKYALVPDQGLMVVFTVRGSELVGTAEDTIAPSYWAFVDKESGRLLSPWRDTQFGNGHVQPGSTVAFSFAMDDPEQVVAVAHSLNGVVLALATKADPASIRSKSYVDVQALCASNPEKFQNLDTGETGCGN